jgi:beta-galactosidase
LRRFNQIVFYAFIACVAMTDNSAGKDGRAVLNFNHGWEYIRGKGSDSAIPPAFRVPRNKWRVVSVSSEETQAEHAPAVNMFDGNPATFWHSQWHEPVAQYPHEFIIDLGDMYELGGFAYTPRKDSTNGRIRDYELYVSQDGQNWGKPVVSGRFKIKNYMRIPIFNNAHTGRYVRFVAKSGHFSQPFAAISEFEMLKSEGLDRKWKDRFWVVVTSTGVEAGPRVAYPKRNYMKSILRYAKEQASTEAFQWEPVILPHTAQIEAREVASQWQGTCYYRKKFEIPVAYAGRKIFITFEGAMHLAEIWINDTRVFEHAGGYTPFTIDITGVIRYGETNTIFVCLDNRDNPLIPPGKPLGTLDFSYYGGLYRDVYLTVTDPVHITDPVAAGIPAGGGVFVIYSNVTEKSADVHIKTHVKNDYPEPVTCTIRQIVWESPGIGIFEDSERITIPPGNAYQFSQVVTVDAPRLWSPDTPFLYNLETKVLQEQAVFDEVLTKIGIRWIECSRKEGFKLNGKPLKLRGTNRHQDYPWIGNALSDNASYRDMWKIKNAGFNIVRLGHYPQDPSVLDVCDELGLLVIDPIPGWQFFNSNTVFVERTYQDIRDMIRRDRNHPCVCMWEVILNESWPPEWWKDTAHRIAHEEYPGPQCFTSGDMYGYYGWDILYNDWNENHTRPNDSIKPGFIREYGDYEFGGGSSTTRRRRGAGEQALLTAAWNVQWSHNRHLSQYPWTMGDANWCMFDHNRGCAPSVSACGNGDILRLPKFAYYFFQSQRDPEQSSRAVESGPMVYAANFWTPRTSPCSVVVYSNCDEVELRLNGKAIARKKPDNGPDSLYHPDNIRHTGGKPYDGGNCRNLAHPPFTFSGITWEKGTLTAIGYIKGKKAAEYAVSTPGDAKKLVLEADLCGRPLKADGADAVFVYAYIMDAAGVTVITDNNTEVNFTIDGPVRIVSPSKVRAEAGIATILVQSTGETGEITISADAKNLESGRIIIK